MAKLYIVPTPIGNLDDITLRAVDTLRSVDFILAEDTRTSAVLLKHLGIEKRMYSHHKFNEHATVRQVADAIAGGRDVSSGKRCRYAGHLRSGISAGAHLRRGGHRGRDAAGRYGSDSGRGAERISMRQILFRGIPATEKGRAKRIAALSDEPRTIIIYESPYRVVKCLEQLAEAMGAERQVAVVREITKKFEQTVRGTLAEAIDHFRRNEPRGEFVIVVAGKPSKKASAEQRDADEEAE